MIGVRGRAQGEGLGRLLIEHVHSLSHEDSESEGVTLTTEDSANVSLYEHLGYEVVGKVVVAPELTTWGFFRPD
jgi:GNAT superfamily N-acetyltransferase